MEDGTVFEKSPHDDGRQQDRREVSFGYASRIFSIIELVASHGPISSSEICKHLNLSRTTAWRMTKTLQARGWIRAQQRNGWFVIGPTFDKKLADAWVPRMESLEIDEVLRSWKCPDGIGMIFGVLSGQSTYKIIDSNFPEDSEYFEESLVFGLGATAALIGSTRASVYRHLETFSRNCRPDEAALINSGLRVKELESTAKRGIIVQSHADPCSFAVPLYYSVGTQGAVEFYTLNHSKNARKVLNSLKAQIQVSWPMRHTAENSDNPSLIEELTYRSNVVMAPDGQKI